MKQTRIVGIDYGQRRIGIALSDERKILASALPTLQAEPSIPLTVKKLLQTLQQQQSSLQFEIESIIVGFPLYLSGKKSNFTKEVELFIAELQQASNLPVLPWDERLTSVQAERVMKEGALNRKKRSKKVDQLAAILILQGYLDSLA